MSADLCECGAEVKHPSTGECGRCYQRRYHWENRAVTGPSGGGRQPRVPTETPCNYANAHKKVRRWRGAASLQACVDCGAQAAEWSYDGGSELEQRGMRTRMFGGAYVETEAVWSPRISDYSSRCVPCHRKLDAE